MAATTLVGPTGTINFITFEGPIAVKQPTYVVSTRYGDTEPVIQNMNQSAQESMISGTIEVSGGNLIEQIDSLVSFVGKECTLTVTDINSEEEKVKVWVLGESHNWKTSEGYSKLRLNVTFRVLFKERVTS